MKLTTLGTGTFYVNSQRSGPAYLLEADGKRILIDCGPGTLIRLSEIGITPEDLDYIFITHFHADHTTDLFSLQMNLRLKEFETSEYRTPVIYGPNGIENFTKKLSRVYELPAFDEYNKIKYLSYISEIQLDNLTVKPYKVEHTAFKQAAQAYALRFECDGTVFAFSGDGVRCQGLADVSESADLFLCDTSCAEGYGNAAHMDTKDIGEIADKSNVKKLVLTHFYPRTDSIDLVAEVKRYFSGDVIKAKDLMSFEI